MPSCSVPGCSSRTTKGKKIHMACFPSDPKRKVIWINNIGKVNWEATKHSYICEVSNHNPFFCVIYKYQNAD